LIPGIPDGNTESVMAPALSVAAAQLTLAIGRGLETPLATQLGDRFELFLCD
jgi:hypothetical protein